ncbi:hypothetical protein POSPLADRAFT_1160060 [Postia placenta MAD-698-R-SB12]|uniref:Retroviral polymerase SH3-like domain-containing protein n=1 Tax=Postia placenta MAD-698-R-SB12 TaxID=670580 RepID=A0A1X6MJP9_9APHY|nr:hypothetical protein POSPLADRAFT_1160060 [Postia placenta MAD-698-R-SB12]OSX56539.1 hypothetical protein POSPLADRAFT_1160060 [Postia placenta MAD-698-R-SB12]
MSHEHAGEKPDLAGLPRFGSAAWVHVDPASKLELKSCKGHWVGFDSQSKAHRIYWPGRHTVTVEHDVQFAADTAPASVTTPALAKGETTTNIAQSTLSTPSSIPASVQGETEAVEAAQPTLQRSQCTCTPSQWVQDLTTGKGTAGGVTCRGCR